MNLLKITLLLLFSFSSLASGAGAQILWLRGHVTYNGQKLSKGITIPLGSNLITSKKSYVKVAVPAIGAVKAFSVVLGPDSDLLLSDDPVKSGGHEFLKGAARFLHEKLEGTKSTVAVKTPQVSMGIRGTEYLLKVNPALGESEVVLFEGRIQMGNLKDSANTVDIKPGQWGGLGGRFGNKIAPPITLPKAVLASFEKMLKVK